MHPIDFAPMKVDRRGIKAEFSDIRATSFMEDRRVEINPTKKAPELTIIHEIGHFIDWDSLIADPVGKKAIMEAIRQTLVFDEIDRWKPETSKDVIFKDYFQSEEELFARAYAQWVATKSGEKKLLEPLRLLRKANREAGLLPEQWDDEEFNEIIAPAMDAYFGKWLKSSM